MLLFFVVIIDKDRDTNIKAMLDFYFVFVLALYELKIIFTRWVSE